MTDRQNYYRDLKKEARGVRKKYNIDTPCVPPDNIKRILKAEGVQYIDIRESVNNTRGAYINDEYGITVLINKNLPPDPMAFTLAHELKHHLFDSDLKRIFCSDRNRNDVIEIGAEIFAAEFIFPEQDFFEMLDAVIIDRKCTPGDLVTIKYRTKTTLSYAGLCKRVIYRNYLNAEDIKNIKWKKLEQDVFGTSFKDKHVSNKKYYQSSNIKRYN